MKTALSVFLNSDRTYIAAIEPRQSGLYLAYINSTSAAFDFQQPGIDPDDESLNQIKQLLGEIPGDVERISVTIPSDTVLVTQIPGNEDMDMEQMRQLVSLEIRQTFPKFSFEDFAANVYKIYPGKESTAMLLAVIIAKQDLTNIGDFFKQYYGKIDNIEISQLNAISGFFYNYPELADGTIAIFGIQNNFVDITLMAMGKMIYYNLAPINDENELADICTQEYDKLLASHADYIDKAYLFGAGLTKDAYLKVKEESVKKGIDVQRLNAFRMMSTELNQRERDYCSRVSHVFPPCIGGALPAFFERIKIY